MAETEVLQRVFALRLYGEPDPSSGGAPVVVLSELAKELESEVPADAPKPVLDPGVLDRALVARLIESPPPNYSQPPIHYLLGCYERSTEELRRGGSNEAVKAAVATARDLILNYAGLALFAGVVPQAPALETRGALQLLDALLLRHGFNAPALASAVAPAFGGPAQAQVYVSGCVAMPAGLLEELAARHDKDEGLTDAVAKMVVELSRLFSRISPLGDPAPYLGALSQLLACEPLARAAVGCRQWLPDLKVATGRAAVLSGACWLGPFFNISPIPDQARGAPSQEPSVAALCFAGAEGRRPGDVNNSVSSLRLAMTGVTASLHGCVKALLKRTTKPAMLRWLGGVLEGNGERGKMEFSPDAAVPDGFMANLAAVLLKLCEPFMDTSPASPFWRRVDPGFVAAGGLLDGALAGETRLAADRDEEAAWRERVGSNGAASPSSPTGASPGAEGDERFHFICQAFFLTAHALHLGPVRIIQSMDDLIRELQWAQENVRQTEDMVASSSNPMEKALLERKLVAWRNALDAASCRYHAAITVLLDPALVANMLSYYRLMAAWLTRLATQGSAGGAGALTLPLPDPAPKDFTCMPEYFVEDMVVVLEYVGRSAPHLLSAAAGGVGVRLDEFAVFFTSLMASPTHVRSAFLRSRMSDVLEMWLPQDEEADGGRGFRSRRGGGADLAALFNCHPLVVEHLAPVLLQLYNEIERTEREGAFYFKFRMRVTIANILKYLWSVPQHRAVWLAFVRGEQYRGTSEKFASMLINDTTYLMGEVLKLLKLLREAEDIRADEAKWGAMGAREREEHQRLAAHNGQQLKALVRSAMSVLDTLNFVTEEVDTTRTFLQPHMVTRLADSLDYFLVYLVGPERRQLRIKNLSEFLDPRELLRRLIVVYLHVDAVDRAAPGAEGAVFAAAIGADKRSFRAENFHEALSVLDSVLTVGQKEALHSLSQRALAASCAAEEDEEMGEGVPEEFLCAIMSTPMKDPVLLPSGVVVDRPNIQRHLLSDPTDPFNRQPLTEDQLVPATDVAQRFAEWRRNRSSVGPQ
ncbi:hypothetical protein HYH03_014386 [Edaphochlamys debaryana]|uniref:RING-type E3 ubiquitin transferase n=1 Tax=Edaphochlamys debaryana TaxID=47281 RepID=A0A836BS19_9CHLO|nr:hypothetical protein HYH03_014386 [Edaphochlamys debaryana]|eukprot:KAG2487016.1 hypothetical protein HYH03_014386 [Edaphochlamys debaryana]